MLISNAFAQTAAGSPTSSLMSFLPLVLMFVVLYFIMIRPQMKRQKEHRNMLSELTKGDEIVTSGGLAGKITKVADNFISVEIADGVEINVQKSAVTTLLPKGTLKSL
ncbi:preprotein translocase subunit YajC [Pandoraea thiooxydans]|nr:preprotein translocase subunit YajC [Pandoraea thiooxydans]